MGTKLWIKLQLTLIIDFLAIVKNKTLFYYVSINYYYYTLKKVIFNINFTSDEMFMIFVHLLRCLKTKIFKRTENMIDRRLSGNLFYSTSDTENFAIKI